MLAPLLAAALLVPAPPCRPDQLLGFAFLQGAAGWMYGGVALANRSDRPCTLRGYPRVRFVDRHGTPLRIRYFRDTSTALPPLVRLAPNRRYPGPFMRQDGEADVYITWMNWCTRSVQTPIRLRMDLPDGGTMTLRLHTGLPRCDVPRAGSWVSVEAFRRRP